MALTRKLDTWQTAKLITPDQASAIRAYEAEHGRGLFKNGIAYIGVFSIILGFALIIAANWQDIPAAVKLGTHFALNAALTGLVYIWRNNPAREKHREGALFLLWGLTLTLIALIGQTFQLSGSAWDAARSWFVLTTPMILWLAQGRYLSALWAVFFVLFIPLDLYANIIGPMDNTQHQTALFVLAYTTLPALLYAAARIPALHLYRPHVALSLQHLSTLLALGAASIVSTFYYHHTAGHVAYAYALPTALAVIAALICLRRRFAHKHDIDLLALCAAFTALPFILPVHGELPALLHMLALWLVAGYIFQSASSNRLLNLAIIVITIRLFIGFLELFGSMMMSGFGFIIIGLVLIALLYGARYTKKRLVKPT